MYYHGRLINNTAFRTTENISLQPKYVEGEWMASIHVVEIQDDLLNWIPIKIIHTSILYVEKSER